MLGYANFQQECTLYVRNLDERVTEKLLEELFTQVGPVNIVTIRETQQQHKTSDAAAMPKTPANRYGFIEFADVESVLFACEVMDAVEIYGQKLKVQPRDNTTQKDIYAQLEMNKTSWERHHSSANNSKKSEMAEKSRSSARHSDIGVYNELQQQPTAPAAGRQRVVTFNQIQGQFALPLMPLPQAQTMPTFPVHSHPKGNSRQHPLAMWSPSPSAQMQMDFAQSAGPSDFYPQLRVDAPIVRRINEEKGDRYKERPTKQANFRSLLQFDSVSGPNFVGRRSAPYYRERSQLSKETFHRKSDR